MKAREVPRRSWRQRSAIAVTAALCLSTPAQAFRIELKDVAPDRIERQRAAAMGQVPLPGTPNVAQFEQRLKSQGMSVGAAMLIRVFKSESELEVWLQKGERFELFATYPICHWSGTLGPKTSEGDKQAPEGVYTVTQRQLHMIGRHPRSLNLGFPNVFDRQFQRTGSYILIHGACGSVGCYAMTNPVIEEVFTLAQGAIKNGQEAIQVHAFPFRMSEQRLQAYALHEWYDFWRNLKDVHDAFEKTKRPPQVSVCEGRYWVNNTMAGHGSGNGEVASQGPLAVCGAVASSNSPTENASPLSSWSRQQPLGPPARLAAQPVSRPGQPVPQAGKPPGRPATALGRALRPLEGTLENPKMVRHGNLVLPVPPLQCRLNRPSCRKWFELQNAKIEQQKLALSKQAAPNVASAARIAPRRP